MNPKKEFSFYEFFAGGGMARAGLGNRWKCLLANDFDHKKCATYSVNWGGEQLKPGDVRLLKPSDLPGIADLVWASFPCQDLSLAGGGAGLKGERSGTFWPFWRLIKSIANEGRAPSVIVLENVVGAVTSHRGKDFSAICKALMDEGYRVGAVIVDAALFVPQSRPRLFIIAVRADLKIPKEIVGDNPMPMWHTRSLKVAYNKLTARIKENWIWWRFDAPTERTITLSDIIEENPSGVVWHTKEQTSQLINMMSDLNLEKLQKAKRLGRRAVGAVYKRTRRDEAGIKVQRAEVRFDDIAGCLRTPAGGSSRQLIIVVDGSKVRSRLISSRETARLMGLPDSYILPERYNEAYHLTGDGVVVPVVQHLAERIIEPIINEQIRASKEAA